MWGTCPRCKCGVTLDEIYPDQAKMGVPFYRGNTDLKASPTFEDGVNQDLNKNNSGMQPNPNLRRGRYDL